MKTKLLIILALLATVGCSSDSDDDDAPTQQEVDDACDSIASELGQAMVDCGAEASDFEDLELTCEGASGEDVDDMNECGDEIASATCEDLIVGEGMPVCTRLDDDGKISL